MLLCGMMASLFCGTIATAVVVVVVVVEVDVEMEFFSCAKECVHSKKNTRNALI